MFFSNLYRSQLHMPILATSFELDPWNILKDTTYDTGSDTSVFHIASLGNLFYLLKTNIIILAGISITVCLISMLFVSKSQMKAEKKQDLMYRLGLVFILFSAPTLFTWVKSMCDALLS